MEAVDIHQITVDALPTVIETFAQHVYGGDRAEAIEHFEDHADGLGDTFLARAGGVLAGYVTIRWVSHNVYFRENNIPFIHHLEVFPAYKRRGIADRLLDSAETLIATRATQAGISVGIFDAYGPAQKLYARRGYIPDGRGVCQHHRPITEGEQLTINHDLIIWMIKKLTPNNRC